MPVPTPRSYCHACGSPYSAQTMADANPHRKCNQCFTVAWANPIPIGVMLQPVYDYGWDKRRMKIRIGLLVGLRGIQPKLGQWGLPGGFADLYDHNYEYTAQREKGEEVVLAEHPDYVEQTGPARLLWSLPGDPGQIIAFSEAANAIPTHWLDSFVPCHECPQVRVAWEPEQLCFASHTEAMHRWFAEQEESPLPRRWRHETLLDHSGTHALHYEQRQALQDACTHEYVEAPDLYDYHKRESFQRCAKCLLTV